MTFSDEDLPHPAKKLFTPAGLDGLGIEELNAYIGALESEISRVRAAIAGRQAHAQAAAAFFKAPPEK